VRRASFNSGTTVHQRHFRLVLDIVLCAVYTGLVIFIGLWANNRNALITSKYNKFEDGLRNGCRIRMLLTDPSSDAIVVAAGRYYAGRSPASSRERVHHMLRLLAELKRSTGGDLLVRRTSHPLAMGMIAVNGSPDSRSETSALFVEYYPYQAAQLEEPKLVLQPADQPCLRTCTRRLRPSGPVGATTT